MGRRAAVVALLTLVLLGSVASFAQTSRALPAAPGGGNFVQYGEVGAISDGEPGVLIRWQMTYETHNIGFYIYRDSPDGPQLVDPTFIGGFATKSNAATGTNTSYEFYDTDGGAGSVYCIQSLSADGRRLSTPTFTPTVTDSFELLTGHPKPYYDQLAANTNGVIQARDMRLPKGLQTTVDRALRTPDPVTQHWVASQPGAKIAVKQDGMYRVTRAELENAGFSVNSNSANWRLFQEGNEQAIIVGPGDQYIEFYGRSLDTVDSDTRIYYLIADNVAGKRINTRVLRNLGGNVVSTDYTAAVVRKERTQYISNVLNGPAENYWGALISDIPTTVHLVLTDIDMSVPTANVAVRLQGSGFINGPHRVHATLNGHELGLIDFGDVENALATFTVPTNYLIEGSNSFAFTSQFSNDFSFFDTATISFGRHYRSEGDTLTFFTPGYRKVEVANFSSPDVRVFDITYDGNTQLLINFPVVADGATYTAKLPSDRAAVMCAVEGSAFLHSPSVTFNTPSTLFDQGNAADVIIISYSAADYMTAAEQWANYRRSPAGGAFRVKTVDIADVYDEFSYGSQSTDAVRDLLAYADANWQSPAPRYVLFIGDSSYDPRNYEGTGNWAFVPTAMVNTAYQETGSDDALVPDLDHDNVPDMAIGRIPARTAADITTILNKTMAFETPALWDLEHRGAVCAYDSATSFDFEPICLAFMSHLPPGTPVTYVRSRDATAHEQIITALNAGPYAANWSGNGTPTTWGLLGFFTINDVPSLVNRDQQSIYTMLTDLNGYFVRPVPDSIAEALIKAPDGGGVATWAASITTLPDRQLLIGERFYQQISLGQINRIGDLVVDARSHGVPPGGAPDYSFVLLGDPSLKVRP